MGRGDGTHFRSSTLHSQRSFEGGKLTMFIHKIKSLKRVDRFWNSRIISVIVKLGQLCIFFLFQRCKVNTIAWSHLSPDNVISGDDLGTIVIWDVKVNATRFLTFGRQSIHVLETHPFIENVVGYGCRLGLVFIVDISGLILVSNLSYFFRVKFIENYIETLKLKLSLFLCQVLGRCFKKSVPTMKIFR